MPKDYYKILGVESTATMKEIKSAYRKLVKIWHPDKNHGSKKATKTFMDIVDAYEVVSQPPPEQTWMEKAQCKSNAKLFGTYNGVALSHYPDDRHFQVPTYCGPSRYQSDARDEFDRLSSTEQQRLREEFAAKTLTGENLKFMWWVMTLPVTISLDVVRGIGRNLNIARKGLLNLGVKAETTPEKEKEIQYENEIIDNYYEGKSYQRMKLSDINHIEHLVQKRLKTEAEKADKNGDIMRKKTFLEFLENPEYCPLKEGGYLRHGLGKKKRNGSKRKRKRNRNGSKKKKV